MGWNFYFDFSTRNSCQSRQSENIDFISRYKSVINALKIQTNIKTEIAQLAKLPRAKGMVGMLSLICLIISAMVLGGIMEVIGALATIAKLSLASSVFGLFTCMALSCLAIHLTASYQYLAVVVPVKMFAEAHKQKNLVPENLNQTLENTVTVTSALVP